MNRKIVVTALAVIMAMSAMSCKKPEEAQNDTVATNVTVYMAGMDSIQNNVEYTGEIKANEETIISPKINAKITKINVEQGDYVEAGQVLAELDATDVQNAYNSALAGYKSALAGYNSVTTAATRQSSTSAKNALTNAQLGYNDALIAYNRELELYNNGQNAMVVNAQQAYDNALDAYNREKQLYDNDTALVAAKNALDAAKENEQRTTQLYSIGAVSQAEYDNAVRNTANAQSNYDTMNSQKQTALNAMEAQLVNAREGLNTAKVNASAALDAAKSRLTSSEKALEQARENVNLTATSNEANVASSQAALESAKTALNTASNNLANTKILALTSGVIASSNAKLGAMAAAGNPLFTVKNTKSLVAEISVTESVIPYIALGTRAKMSISAAELEGVDGVVTLVNPTKNEQTGMYTVQISLDNSQNLVNVGMFANVSLTLQDIVGTITVPNEAVLLEDEENFVYVVNADQKTAQKRKVVIGLETDEKVEIASGVNAGEKVVVSGVDFLSEENNQINIVEE